MRIIYKSLSSQYVLIIIAFFAQVNYCSGQSIDELKKRAMNTNRLTLAHGDSVETFFITANSDKNKRYLKDNFYSWYRASEIKQTQGSAAGRLLIGEYSLFTRDLSLIERGNYEEGQRKGTWRQWYPQGSLKRQEMWQKGTLTGSFTEYYPNGTLLKQGKYKKNALHGLVKEYNQEGTVTKKKYKNGLQKRQKIKKNTKKRKGR